MPLKFRESGVTKIVIDNTTAQTVGGVKTFSSIPILPASNPTSDNQAARKAYVDSVDAQKVNLTESRDVNLTGKLTALNPEIMISPLLGLKIISNLPIQTFSTVMASESGYALGDGPTRLLTFTLVVNYLCRVSLYNYVNVGGSQTDDWGATLQDIYGVDPVDISYDSFIKAFTPLADISLTPGGKFVLAADRDGITSPSLISIPYPTAVYPNNTRVPAVDILTEPASKTDVVFLTPGTYTYKVFYDNGGAGSSHSYSMTLVDAVCPAGTTAAAVLTITPA